MIRPNNANEGALLAAVATGKEEFTRAELAVAARDLCPEFFQLRGAPAPFFDCNALFASLARDGGVVARGWIKRVGLGTYAVTRDGRRRARALDADVPEPVRPVAVPPPPPPVVSRVDAAILWHLTRAQAVMRNARGGVAITSRDAEDFWRAGGGADRTGDLLARACADGAVHGEGAAPPDRGRLMQIRTLHLVLVNRFAAPAAEGAPT